MGLESGKHIEKEINEIRCKVVETGISKARIDFLKPLLEHNGYEVHFEELKKKEAKELAIRNTETSDDMDRVMEVLAGGKK